MHESDGGSGELLEENEDEVEEYDSEVDGPEDQYEPIGSRDYAWLDRYKKLGPKDGGGEKMLCCLIPTLALAISERFELNPPRVGLDERARVKSLD